ncbi:MAG: hypothetical protein KF774_00270 [Planctomyces sp.]|nr:hypothetical protein [Planctomyces sp.]
MQQMRERGAEGGRDSNRGGGEGGGRMRFVDQSSGENGGGAPMSGGRQFGGPGMLRGRVDGGQDSPTRGESGGGRGPWGGESGGGRGQWNNENSESGGRGNWPPQGGDFGSRGPEGGRWGGGNGGGGNWGGDEAGESRSREGGRSGSARGGNNATGERAVEKKPRERYTVDLPASLADLDTDNDGQIGLYEWKRGKSGTVAEFQRIDADGDGFLTPFEIVRSGYSRRSSTANIAANGGNGGNGGNGNNGDAAVANSGAGNGRGDSGSRSAASGPATANVPASGRSAPPSRQPAFAAMASDVERVEIDESSPQARQATRSFNLLDRDGDGTVSAEEWRAATNLRPLFEKAGVDLSEPMSRDQFVSHYVRLNGPRS